jgi:hypothetical protein
MRAKFRLLGVQLRTNDQLRSCITAHNCDVAHTWLAFSGLTLEERRALVPEVDMARQPVSLAFRFGVVLALAVIILVVMTMGAPPQSSDPIYRPQHLLLY